MAFLLLSPVLLWAKPSYWVYSYIDANTDVNGQAITFVNDIPWNDITHLIDTFATPKTSGGLDSTSSCFGSVLVNGAHSHSTRANLSIGGAGNATNFSSDVGTYQSTFIANITKAVTQVGYDGIDIDWEFPASGDRANLQSFMTNLYNAIKALPASSVDGQARTLTIYIGCGDEMCVSSWGNLATACDAIILSGYDFGYDVYNGPIVDTTQTMSNSCDGLSSGYADVTTLFNLLTSNGVPASKCVLGSPLYGNYPAGGYNEVPIITLLTSGVAGSYNSAAMEQLYTYNGNATTANTQQSFCDKINWALSNGMKGIGLWDTAQACPITNSYAAPIWNTIGGNNACVTVGASTPTATFTKTVTKTFTATATMTATNTFTNTVAHTSTPTFTNSATATSTFTNTSLMTMSPTASNTATRTETLTATYTVANTLTPTFSNTATNTYTRTFTSTNTHTSTPTITLTPSNTASATASNTGTIPPTHSPTVTNTVSNTFTSTDTAAVLNTSTPTFTLTASNTATASYTGTAPPTHSPTVTSTFTNTFTATNSSTFTYTPANTSTPTFTSTATQTFTHTAVFTATLSSTATMTNSFTATFSPTVTPSFTPTQTPQVPLTFTPTFTKTNTPLPPTNTPTVIAGCSGIPNWNGNFVAYSLGQKVDYNNEVYQCIQAHTSEPNWQPPVVPALWKDLGACGSISLGTTVSNPVVYPNPATGSTTTLQLPSFNMSNVKVQIFTVAMREVQTRTIAQVMGNTLTISLTDKGGVALADGLYYFMIQGDGQRWINKVLILR